MSIDDQEYRGKRKTILLLQLASAVLGISIVVLSGILIVQNRLSRKTPNDTISTQPPAYQSETDVESSSSMTEFYQETDPEKSHFVETTVIETEAKTIPFVKLPIPTGDEEEIIQWKDPALEKIIRKGLDKPDGDILARDVMNIERLLIMNGSFVFIDDSRFDGLSYEDIRNDVYDKQTLMIDKDNWENQEFGYIQILHDLVYFKELKVISNDIQDIRALRELNNLTKLDLSANRIVDIRALSGLTNLDVLDLNWNRIQDIGALEALKIDTFAFIFKYKCF